MLTSWKLAHTTAKKLGLGLTLEPHRIAGTMRSIMIQGHPSNVKSLEEFLQDKSHHPTPCSEEEATVIA
jgi:hypothetical protein